MGSSVRFEVLLMREKKPCLFNIDDVIEGLSTGCNGDYKQ